MYKVNVAKITFCCRKYVHLSSWHINNNWTNQLSTKIFSSLTLTLSLSLSLSLYLSLLVFYSHSFTLFFYSPLFPSLTLFLFFPLQLFSLYFFILLLSISLLSLSLFTSSYHSFSLIRSLYLPISNRLISFSFISLHLSLNLSLPSHSLPSFSLFVFYPHWLFISSFSIFLSFSLTDSLLVSHSRSL